MVTAARSFAPDATPVAYVRAGIREGFIRAWLAPLVTPGTPEYEGLKRDIFG